YEMLPWMEFRRVLFRSQQRAQRIIEPLARLVAAARRAGVTVVYATDAHTPNDSELRKWPPHAMAGTWNAEIVPGLAPQPGDVVRSEERRVGKRGGRGVE